MLELAFVVEFTEQASEVSIVWSLVKIQIATVCHVRCYLFWIAQAQGVDRCVDLALLDLLVLVIFVPSPKSLPREFTFEHVE